MSAEQRRPRLRLPVYAAHGLPVPTLQQGRRPLAMSSTKWQPLQPRHADVLSGTPTFSTRSEPVFERSAVVAGHSNAVRWYQEGGVGGLAESLRDAI